jgi:hypothetical protein
MSEGDVFTPSAGREDKLNAEEDQWTITRE